MGAPAGPLWLAKLLVTHAAPTSRRVHGHDFQTLSHALPGNQHRAPIKSLLQNCIKSDSDHLCAIACCSHGCLAHDDEQFAPPWCTTTAHFTLLPHVPESQHSSFIGFLG